jgi:hypothetical protein
MRQHSLRKQVMLYFDWPSPSKLRASYGASSFIISSALQWCGVLCVATSMDYQYIRYI